MKMKIKMKMKMKMRCSWPPCYMPDANPYLPPTISPGEMSMLTGEPRTATCSSVGNCCCLIVSAEAWESVLGAYSVMLARGMRRRLLQLLPVIRQITSGLSQSEEKRLLDSFVEREYAPGEFIMHEGDFTLTLKVT